ncbi:MAG TPA: GH92 family glycosyl hydrolase [Candidatus Cybelea sp.]|nr:GH92 family glycosyl hydrolase [Candidatus Cybelea sp.]
MHLFAAALFNLIALVAPTMLVDTFVGTSGTPAGGPIDTFPGADTPFGMVQWSPDTPSGNAGGGYEYSDRQITGFSLTHLSGPGCSVFGDFGVLPAVGAIAGDPAGIEQPFSHASEQSAPGWYAVSVGNPAIRTELSATTRTGIARFTFPQTAQANVIINAASNQAGVSDSSVRVDGPAEVSGSASSGFFCGMPDRYNVYFVAQFDRPFRQYATFEDSGVSPQSASASGPASGLVLTFDATNRQSVKMKVGVSFVSVAGAHANLEAENRGWSLLAVRDRGTEAWNGFLDRIAITGGTTEQQRTFYSAFYHALLHPNVISDVTGLYVGFDGKTHRVKPGHNEYANFSDWDIYRTEAPLLGLIAPGEASDMMQSLVDAYEQSGWLPRWPLVNGPSSVMGGDSIVPVIAGAYAFGARGFDARAALAASVKGATSTQPPAAQGWYYERWELHDEYLRRGYVVNTHTTSVSPVPNGASETLEYALDDFSIARLAQALGDLRTAAEFTRRSANWATLFNGATGWIAGRDADGAFMQAPLTENGQSGFQEGNAAQYTWMVPQDLRDLIAAMGGTRAAAAKLDAFFAQLDAGPDKPYAWLGNEPSLGSPWVYLSLGEPWKAQDVVRRSLLTLYGDTPWGLPGNDDLGTMSAWYLWCAIGLYPQNPAVRYLDVGAPLFSSVTLRAPGGPTIEIQAPQAGSDDPYVQGVTVNGRASNDSWVALPNRGTLRLDFTLGTAANTRWASEPDSAPPAYASSRPELPASTAAMLTGPAGNVELRAGGSAALELQVTNRTGAPAASLAWHATLPSGLRLDSERGTIELEPGASRALALRVLADPLARGGYYDVRFDATAANGARLEHLDVPVRVTRAGTLPAIAYATNRFGNSVSPIDLATGATAAEIAVGEDARAAVLSADAARLYVADAGDNAVSVVDTSAGRSIAKVKVGNDPFALALEPGGKTLWVANGDDGTIQAIDTASLQTGPPLRVGSAPRGIAIAPDGSRLYTANSRGNSITAVDLHTRKVLGEYRVGARPWALAIAPDGARLYVAETASSEVTPVDLTGSLRALPAIPVGVYPVAIAISPDGRLAYVANHANSTITPIDLQRGVALAPIEVGGAPAGIAFTRDGATAIVVTSRDNTAAFVDVRSGRMRRSILLGNGPYAIAAP